MIGLSAPSCNLHNFSDQPVDIRFNGLTYHFEPGEVVHNVPRNVAGAIDDSWGHYGLRAVEHHPQAPDEVRENTVERAHVAALRRMHRKLVEWENLAEATVRDHGDRHALHPDHDHRERFQKRKDEVKALLDLIEEPEPIDWTPPPETVIAGSAPAKGLAAASSLGADSPMAPMPAPVMPSDKAAAAEWK